MEYAENFFPKSASFNGAAMQILNSGPGESIDQIKNGFLQMIARAHHSVYIQTPYFIPDQVVLDTIRAAALSGIDIRIMIPRKADHMLVQKASLSFIGELLPVGVKVYRYDNGFLHAKTLLIDGKVCSTGSANLDIRSFSLNFEVNAFIYDKEVAGEMVRISLNDVRLSDKITVTDFESMSFIEHSKQRFARLIAPIL